MPRYWSGSDAYKRQREALRILAGLCDERDAIQRRIDHQAKVCRDNHGADWVAIAEALGTSKQAAHKRYAAGTTFGRR